MNLFRKHEPTAEEYREAARTAVAGISAYAAIIGGGDDVPDPYARDFGDHPLAVEATRAMSAADQTVCGMTTAIAATLARTVAAERGCSVSEVMASVALHYETTDIESAVNDVRRRRDEGQADGENPG